MENNIEEKMQFAVLIDADNVSEKYAETIFAELEKYGFASCRRIYGNWAKPNGWNENTLVQYSIIPVHQFSYTSGKNSTDMVMVIDAMDILYKDKVDGFCLVTSDSDFTRLAMRLREEMKYVLGMGESKTPIALTKACNKFIHLNLIEENKDILENQEEGSADELLLSENVTSMDTILGTIQALYAENGQEALDLGLIGNRLSQKFSDFDVRNYGYTKLSVFLKEEMPDFNVEKRENHHCLSKKNALTKEELEKEIIKIIRENDGCVENLSIISQELKKTHPNFDTKDYGYSRISSFLRSFGGLSVQSNEVRVK